MVYHFRSAQHFRGWTWIAVQQSSTLSCISQKRLVFSALQNGIHHVEPLSHGYTDEMDEAIFGATQISLWFWRCNYHTNQYWIPIFIYVYIYIYILFPKFPHGFTMLLCGSSVAKTAPGPSFVASQSGAPHTFCVSTRPSTSSVSSVVAPNLINADVEDQQERLN